MVLGFCIGVVVGANIGLIIFSLFGMKRGAGK